MGHVLLINENWDFITFNDGFYIAFSGLIGEYSSSTSESSVSFTTSPSIGAGRLGNIRH